MSMKYTNQFFIFYFKFQLTVSQNILCPSVGHHPHDLNGCSNVFYKCMPKAGLIEGFMHECEEGEAYWPVSRRCVDAKSIPLCSSK